MNHKLHEKKSKGFSETWDSDFNDIGDLLAHQKSGLIRDAKEQLNTLQVKINKLLNLRRTARRKGAPSPLLNRITMAISMVRNKKQQVERKLNERRNRRV